MPKVPTPPKPRPAAGGRPVVSKEKRLIQRSLRMTLADWASFDHLGGVKWLRLICHVEKPVAKKSKK